jgi:UDP-glucose 4-epimerase
VKVVVTGAAGYFGGILIPAFLALPGVTAVVGVDRLPNTFTHPAYTHVVLDLATATPADWAPILADASKVVHLAFRVAHHVGEDTATTNGRGQRVFLTAALAEDRQVVVSSATAVYGFDAGRDSLASALDEDQRLNRNTRVPYADDKHGVEAMLDELAPGSAATVVRARPVNVVGPTMPVRRAPLLTNPVMFVPLTSHPIRQQLLHEADLAAAFVRLLDAPAGAYNVGPDDWLRLEDAARITGQGVVRLPALVLRGMADLAWRTGQSAFDGSWLAFFEHPPIIVANSKLRALGWTPRYTTESALREIVPLLRGT